MSDPAPETKAEQGEGVAHPTTSSGGDAPRTGTVAAPPSALELQQAADAEDLIRAAQAAKARAKAAKSGTKQGSSGGGGSGAAPSASIAGSVYKMSAEVVEAQRRAAGCLEKKASMMSQLTFWFLNPIMRLATERGKKKSSGAEFGPGTLYVRGQGRLVGASDTNHVFVSWCGCVGWVGFVWTLLWTLLPF